MQKIRRIFPGGNTAHGFISFHDNIISDNRRMKYIIKGMPGGGKSSLMKDIGERLVEKNYSIEYHHCPSDPYSIDGIAIKDLGIAIVDGTPPHSIDPLYPGLKDKIIDLSGFLQEDIIKDKAEDIIQARKNNKYAYGKAFGYLKAAKTVYEIIEEENKRLVDHKQINRVFREIKEAIFSKEEIEIEDNCFKERYLFSNAYTPEGFIDYTSTILEWISDIYYLEGEIGNRGDKLLASILDEARMRNYHVEIYFHPLIPNKIESIYIKELDSMLTTNKNALNLAKSISKLQDFMDLEGINKDDYKTFDHLLDKGIASLRSAKNNHFILEKSYRPAIDYSKIDRVREEIYREILNSD